LDFLVTGETRGWVGGILALCFLGGAGSLELYAQEEEAAEEEAVEEAAAEPFVPPTYGYRQLTFYEGPHSDTDPCVSPDGTTVGFVRTLPDDKGCMICAVPSQGGDVAVLTDLKRGQALGLCWTPDGQNLVFGFFRRGKNGEVTDLRQVAVGGDGKVQSYQGRNAPPVGKHPAVSKDGKLAYIYRNNMVVEIGGQEQIYLTRSGFQERPDWSDDGKWLIYHSSPGLALQDSFQEDAKVHRMRIMEGAEGHGWCSFPRFSPDAQDVLCVGLRDQRYDVWVMPRGDVEPYPVTQDEFMELGADWLMDRSVVFSSNRSGDYALWLAIEGYEEETTAEEGEDEALDTGAEAAEGTEGGEDIPSEETDSEEPQ